MNTQTKKLTKDEVDNHKPEYDDLYAEIPIPKDLDKWRWVKIVKVFEDEVFLEPVVSFDKRQPQYGLCVDMDDFKKHWLWLGAKDADRINPNA